MNTYYYLGYRIGISHTQSIFGNWLWSIHHMYTGEGQGGFARSFDEAKGIAESTVIEIRLQENKEDVSDN